MVSVVKNKLGPKMEIEHYYAPVCALDEFAEKMVKVLLWLLLCFVCGMVFGYVTVEDGDDDDDDGDIDDEEAYEDGLVCGMESLRV